MFLTRVQWFAAFFLFSLKSVGTQSSQSSSAPDDREAAVAALNRQYQHGHPTNLIAEAGVLLRMLDGWSGDQLDVTAYDQADVWGGSAQGGSTQSEEISTSLLNRAISDPQDLDRVGRRIRDDLPDVCMYSTWTAGGPPVGFALNACVVDPALKCSYPRDINTDGILNKFGSRCGSMPPQNPQDQLIETLQEQEANISCALWGRHHFGYQRIWFGYNEIVLNGTIIDMSIRNAQFGAGCRPIQAMVRICGVCSKFYVGDVQTDWDPESAFETYYNVSAPPLIWFDRHNGTAPFRLSCDRQPSHDECVRRRRTGLGPGVVASITCAAIAVLLLLVFTIFSIRKRCAIKQSGETTEIQTQLSAISLEG